MTANMELSKLCLSAFYVLVIYVSSAFSDTPANCTFEDIRGTWSFQLGQGNNDKTIDCSKPFKTGKEIIFNLAFPDVATDQFGNKGFWTLIYNQGFEVVIAGRKYFGFSQYANKTSYCSNVSRGWSHDLLGHDWACYNGRKSVVAVKPDMGLLQTRKINKLDLRINSPEMLQHIHSTQKLWTATHYPQFEGYTPEDFIRIAGGRQSRINPRPKRAPLTSHHKRIAESLPGSFDWRNVDGISYVSPVRNQEKCGSCYAFASMALAETRVRIQTNNTQTPVFSTQDIVECSNYSQGCEGGFPYLVAGKYAEDFGLVLDKCNPYKGIDGKCHTDPSCDRHYFTNYSYVGGFYGSCNDVLMQQAIHQNGPIAVSFEVYKDFLLYQGGVYVHTGVSGLGKFNPFDLTNHVVLIVGWGALPENEGGTKYWIVKNSWGTSWGLDGYFKIRRGTDECGIESIAVETTPVYKFER